MIHLFPLPTSVARLSGVLVLESEEYPLGCSTTSNILKESLPSQKVVGKSFSMTIVILKLYTGPLDVNHKAIRAATGVIINFLETLQSNEKDIFQ